MKLVFHLGERNEIKIKKRNFLYQKIIKIYANMLERCSLGSSRNGEKLLACFCDECSPSPALSSFISWKMNKRRAAMLVEHTIMEMNMMAEREDMKEPLSTR